MDETADVPDFLNPELLAWRERATRLAHDHLVALRDDASLDERSRRRAVAAASRQAGLHGLAQPAEDGAVPSALTLLVVREALAAAGCGGVRGVFGDGPGVTSADPFFGGAGPARTGCTHCGACMTGCRATITLKRLNLWLFK